MSTIQLDYDLNSVPRYGYGRPFHFGIHDLIEARRSHYQQLLQEFLAFTGDFVSIPREQIRPDEPYWNNGFLPSLDIVSLHSLLCLHQPQRFLEIGSGNSTLVARRAITLRSLPTRIISIDPMPRAEVDTVCDEVHRSPVEVINPEIFEQLEAGDFLFIDSSHRTFMNSDVTMIFLDVLPVLPPGVFVHFHDIFWPADYPPVWTERYYSEQYLLACWLLAGSRLSIELPVSFVSNDRSLSQVLAPLASRPEMQNVPLYGGSFWLRTA
jgi:hypothetical protein